MVDTTFGQSGEEDEVEVEAEEGGERKRKKKKGLKEAIMEKISGDDNNHKVKDTCIEELHCTAAQEKEKEKKFLDKITAGNDNNKGGDREEGKISSPPCEESQSHEKRGTLERIKEKLPAGTHHANDHHHHHQD